MNRYVVKTRYKGREGYFVVNAHSKAIQSSWLTNEEAQGCCEDLNKFEDRLIRIKAWELNQAAKRKAKEDKKKAS